MKYIYKTILFLFAMVISTMAIGQSGFADATDVYTTNPYKTMHIVIQQASINNYALATDDEVAIYNDDVCLGFATVGDDGVSIATPLIIAISYKFDDVNTHTGIGFVADDEIQFRIFDESTGQTYFENHMTPVYQAGYDDEFTENGTAIVVSLVAQSNFSVNWQNPYTPMNLVVLAAEVEGAPNTDLGAGDEIGVYDIDDNGNIICVGNYILSAPITTFIQIVLSADDPMTPAVDGFIDDGLNHKLILRFYDVSEGKVYYNIKIDANENGNYVDDVLFDALGTSTVSLIEVTSGTQTISDVNAGWNIISYYVEDVYGVDNNGDPILDVNNDIIYHYDLKEILELNPDFVPVGATYNVGNATPELVKILDEQGGFIEFIPAINGYINTIGTMKTSEGYYLKVDEGTTNLVANGTFTSLPDTIALLNGWNIMGYPVQESQNAMNLLSSLTASGQLVKLMDEEGRFIQNIAGIGWVNTLVDEKLNPGEGYYIKVSEATSLIFDYPYANLAPTVQEEVYTFNTTPNKSTAETHFTKVWDVTNPFSPMNFIISTGAMANFDLNIGDELAVYDGDACVGVMTFSDLDSEYFTFVAAANDPTTDEIDGFTDGNQMTFVYWNSATQTESFPSLTYVEGNGTFTQLGTYVADFMHSVNDNSIDSFISTYPNPFNITTNISFALAQNSNIELVIFDVYGKQIQTIAQGNYSSGIQNISFDRSGLSNGFYFARLIVKETNQIFTIKLVVQ